MTARVGVLHTVPALAPVFHDLLLERDPELDILHVADPALLATTVAAGEVTEPVRTAIELHLSALRDAGALRVLVTCSSIGEECEQAAIATGVALSRVDAPMAASAIERAVAAGSAEARPGRILVLATLGATLTPTRRLIERLPPASGMDIVSHVVPGAAQARTAGDTQTHDRLILEVVQRSDADVIVLAQASMAAGAGDDPRVLTSPESGADGFVADLNEAR